MDVICGYIKSIAPILTQALGSFLGIFLGFVLGQLSEKTKENRSRWKEHGSALAKIEHRLQAVLGLISDNKISIKSALGAIANLKNNTPIVRSEPHILPLDLSTPLPLLRLKVINELFAYDQTIRKINNDTKMINQAFGEMRSAFIIKGISEEQYIISLKEYGNNLKILEEGYNLIDSETMHLLSVTRLALKYDKLIFIKKFLFRIPPHRAITDIEITHEIKKVENEIQEVQQRSKDKISQYFSDSPSEE
jgi:hypothetical protein